MFYRLGGLSALAIVALATTDSSAADRPNVVLLLTDDQGYGDLGCHGNPVLRTPNIDALYRDSIRFTDFHVSPFCTPTRAALMTGNHPGYTGAFRTSSGRTMMHRDEVTIADLFADAGYTTGMVGKWHLGDNAPHRPQDRGFQDVVWHRCGGVGQASDYWGNDYFDDTYERNGQPERFEGYCTDVWFREATRFIEQNQDKPFFLYLATNAPHSPYLVPKEWATPYVRNRNVANANFYGMIANIDHNLAMLRERLSDLGLAENTILIFMTDNGTAAGGDFRGLDSEPTVGFNAGMRGKKASVYEGGHRVPFFIHWPKGGLNGGRDIDTLAAHIDVLPTLSDLCGIAVPDDDRPDGVSLKPLLSGSEEAFQRDHHVLQYHGGPGAETLPSKPYEFSVVMTERWRLVNSNGQRLYDIEADPAQRNDVAKEHPDVVDDLRERYQPFWARVSPRLTPVRIDIGNPAESPTVLSSQDWYMPAGNSPWNFNMIKKLPKVTGPWMLQVQKAGQYRITLRQFPREANKPVVAERAKIEIAGQAVEQPVQASSRGVVFELDLPAGPTELLTQLIDVNGEAGGAYFTEVEALGSDPVSDHKAPRPQYDGSWRSLQEMPVPAWFDDGKIGIFIHWGPYSAIGYRKGDRGYAEHVPKMLYQDREHYYPYMKDRWGATPPEFGYKDIVGEFKAENWDPDQWAKLFDEVGAKYVVLTAEHHDGWANWDSDLTPWNAVDMGPKRDLVGDLGRAVRKRGLKFAPSYHRERHTGFFAKEMYVVHSEPRPDIIEEIRRVPAAASLYGPFSYDKAFVDDYVARWKEIQTKYQPDFLWVDDFPIYTRDGNQVRSGKMKPEIKYLDDQARGMITDFMNDAAARQREVYCNNKGANRNWPDGVGCLEKDNLKLEVIGPKWQSCTTFGTSFGYLAAEDDPDYRHKKKSVEEVIHEMVEVISRNGNFLINIGPRADGTIPAWQVERLRAMGDWLKINGRAIYGTRYWKVNQQADGRLAFTAKGKNLYAIALTKPTHPLTIEASAGWKDGAVKSVRLLGSASAVEWKLTPTGLQITPPRDLGQSTHAWAFEIETDREQHEPNVIQRNASKALRGTKKVDLEGNSTQ
ncbi:Arylsulfatase precursor [Pirellulimonas nuda]|uniref:alpha-L-fucosidase n=1 Tax=Pirellulimonas nuda TaxID=2528009 RepID=A0A518DBJ9_9BACT|nr:alpha-L-fucosidase [Pirellulimonas nuda]QDU88855.1 Arylsulfatase precursor [Pirellulimonas nuda]